jgi:molybdopterin synthase catalytic subunit
MMMSAPTARTAATATTIRVTARLFARYAELTGVKTAALELPSGAAVRDAVAALRSTVPKGEQLPARPLVAVNLAHALPDQLLSDGDELALLPPLAGG